MDPEDHVGCFELPDRAGQNCVCILSAAVSWISWRSSCRSLILSDQPAEDSATLYVRYREIGDDGRGVLVNIRRVTSLRCCQPHSQHRLRIRRSPPMSYFGTLQLINPTAHRARPRPVSPGSPLPRRHRQRAGREGCPRCGRSPPGGSPAPGPGGPVHRDAGGDPQGRRAVAGLIRGRAVLRCRTSSPGRRWVRRHGEQVVIT